MYLVLFASALAAVPVDMGVSAAVLANDPYVTTTAAGLSVGVWPHPRLGLSLDGSWSPTLGSTDFKPVTVQMVTANRVSPDISRVRGQIGGSLAFVVARGLLAGRRGSRLLDLDLVVTAGSVWTREDAEALQISGDPSAEGWQTLDQRHFFHGWGPRARIRIASGLSLAVTSSTRRYTEVVAGDVLEVKKNHWLGLGVRFDRSPGDRPAADP